MCNRSCFSHVLKISIAECRLHQIYTDFPMMMCVQVNRLWSNSFCTKIVLESRLLSSLKTAAIIAGKISGYQRIRPRSISPTAPHHWINVGYESLHWYIYIDFVFFKAWILVVLFVYTVSHSYIFIFTINLCL